MSNNNRLLYRFNRSISLILLLSALISIFIGIEYIIIRYFSIILITIIFFIPLYRHLNFNNYYIKFSYFVLIISTFIGLYNISRINGNNIFEWLQYSLSYFCALVCFQIGWALSKLNDREYQRSLGLIALADTSALIPRFILDGTEVRSSLGVSPVFAYWLNSGWAGRKLPWAVSILFILLHSVLTIASGLRSLILGILANIYYFLTQREWRIYNIQLLIVTIVTTTALGSVFVASDFPILSRGAEIIQTRFEQTLFSDEGIKLDPKEGGRTEESLLALYQFQSNQTAVDIIFGRGYGFVFYDYYKGEKDTAHIHLTLIASYVREGIMGAARYSWLLLWVYYATFYNVILRRKKCWELVVSSVLVSYSLVSGYLIDPIYWLFIGYSLNGAFIKKTRKPHLSNIDDIVR